MQEEKAAAEGEIVSSQYTRFALRALYRKIEMTMNVVCTWVNGWLGN